MDNYWQDIQVINWKTQSNIHLLRQVHIIQISLGDKVIKIYYRPYGSNEEKYIVFEKHYNILQIS